MEERVLKLGLKKMKNELRTLQFMVLRLSPELKTLSGARIQTMSSESEARFGA